MDKENLKKWIDNTKEKGYIDCDNHFDFDNEEFNFIINMAEELYKRL